jgi:hypothetical protein
VTVRSPAWLVRFGCLVVIGLAVGLIATAGTWVSLPSSSESQRVTGLLADFPATDTHTDYGLVVWTRHDGGPLSAADMAAVAARVVALAPLAAHPDSVRENLAANRKAILIELPLPQLQSAPESAARNRVTAGTMRNRASAALPSDLMAQVTGTVTAVGSPPVSYQATSEQAQKTIDAAYGTGFGNRAVMLVPQSLAGETSTIAPTTLAMDFDTVHSVTRESSHAGRSELIVAIDADPGSARALAAVRGIRASLARTGGPTARTMVGGADAMEIDLRSAVASARLLILLSGAGVLVLGAMTLTVMFRNGTRHRPGPNTAANETQHKKKPSGV